MKLTNKFNLPQSIYLAVMQYDEDYTSGRGSTELSASQFSKPILQLILEKRYWSELEDDVSDRLYSLQGTAMHAILAKSNPEGHLVEGRLTADVDGFKISGAFDDYTQDGIISDFKNTSVYAATSDKPEWETQLNILSYICQKNGFPVNGLRIECLLRDWSIGKSKSNPEFPEIPFITVKFPMWTIADIETKIKEKINDYKRYKDIQADAIPECSCEERWERPTRYACIKLGNKRARKLCETEKEAQNELKSGEEIIVRPRERVRCQNYCILSKNSKCPYYTRKVTEDAELQG